MVLINNTDSGNARTSTTKRDAVTARKKGIKNTSSHNCIDKIMPWILLLHVGLKRKCVEDDSLAESLVKVFADAERCAGEREDRMRKLKLEMEERRREAEDRREALNSWCSLL